MVRTLRKGANDNYVGIVKIELGSEQEVETVLQHAKKLSEHPDPSVSKIFIRPSKPDIERMNDRSWNAVLDVVDPNRSSLFVHPKWGGVRKTRGGFRGGNRGGRGRGRGRGGRGARGRGRGGGRGQHQSGIDYENAWSPSLIPSGRGRGAAMGRGGTPQSSSPVRGRGRGSNRSPSPAPFSSFTQRSVSQQGAPHPNTHSKGTNHGANQPANVLPPAANGTTGPPGAATAGPPTGPPGAATAAHQTTGAG